jgi:hypothetical protein
LLAVESTEWSMSDRDSSGYVHRMSYESAPDAFLSALSTRDFGRFAESLAPQAQARLLLPPGPEVRSGREEIARRFEGWFARATDFEVLDAQRAKVGLKDRLSWRFRLRREGRSREVIEQVAFVSMGPEGISEIDLLCSGFHRDEEAEMQCTVDATGSLGDSLMGGSSVRLKAVGT